MSLIVTSREYKVMLNTGRFEDREAGCEAIWELIDFLARRQASLTGGVAIEKTLKDGKPDDELRGSDFAVDAKGNPVGVGDLAAWAQRALEHVTGSRVFRSPLSVQVRRVIAAVEDGRVDERDQAARVAHLSATRLTHRFSAEVGLPFRRFVLWSRLKKAVAAVRDGADLTRAAVEAGFSDAAHFSRTFRRMFGISADSLRVS